MRKIAVRHKKPICSAGSRPLLLLEQKLLCLSPTGDRTRAPLSLSLNQEPFKKRGEDEEEEGGSSVYDYVYITRLEGKFLNATHNNEYNE